MDIVQGLTMASDQPIFSTMTDLDAVLPEMCKKFIALHRLRIVLWKWAALVFSREVHVQILLDVLLEVGQGYRASDGVAVGKSEVRNCWVGLWREVMSIPTDYR